MLTARSEEVDTLIGLSVGADDYMSKPFSPRELMARIQAMLRRPRPLGQHADGQPPARSFGPLSIDPVGRDVWLAGTPVSLTRTEFDLLATLSERPRMAFSRRQLIDAVWGSTWIADEHLVDVHIGHLQRPSPKGQGRSHVDGGDSCAGGVCCGAADFLAGGRAVLGGDGLGGHPSSANPRCLCCVRALNGSGGWRRTSPGRSSRHTVSGSPWRVPAPVLKPHSPCAFPRQPISGLDPVS